MCLTVYLATDRALPLVAWSQESPGFNVEPLRDPADPVRRQLNLPTLYNLGSHTFCGCGFLRDGAEDDADVQASREALVAYASDAVRSGPVELYVCWNGDAEDPCVQRLVLTPSDLLGREDWLEEGTHVRLEAEA